MPDERNDIFPALPQSPGCPAQVQEAGWTFEGIVKDTLARRVIRIGSLIYAPPLIYIPLNSVDGPNLKLRLRMRVTP